VQKPKITLTLAASGACNDTLHGELVSSVNSSVVGQAPAEVQDAIMVNKGPCTNVSRQAFAVLSDSVFPSHVRYVSALQVLLALGKSCITRDSNIHYLCI
jgi:hypothetical protein